MSMAWFQQKRQAFNRPTGVSHEIDFESSLELYVEELAIARGKY